MLCALFPTGGSAASRTIVCGSGAFFIMLLYRLWRSSRRASEGNITSSQGHSEEYVQPEAAAGLTLPICVDGERLPTGWSLGQPLFYAPSFGVVPLVQREVLPKKKGDDIASFIVCDGPHLQFIAENCTESDLFTLFLQYMKHTPFLMSFADRGASIKSLESTGLSCGSGCFSYVVHDTIDCTFVAFGLNGPYIISLIVTPFVMPGECVGSTSSTGVSDLSTLQSFLNACELVPLVDKVRLPGTPPASQLGKFHLCCRYGNCVARFTVSSILCIRNGGKGHSPLFTLEGNFFRDGCLLVDVTTVSLLAAGKTFDELFPHATISSVSISSLVQLVGVECIAGDSDEVVVSGGASTGNCHKGSAYNLLLSRGEVSVIFHHSPLGVHFPVDTQSGAVYDSLITTDLCVMYYPLGSMAAPLSSSGAENSLPSVTIRRFTHLPSTWEQSLERDDTLKHNALYHFTDWVRGRVPCVVCELSGFRCAQLHQEDVGMSCRTYVVPLTGAILVVRWETPTQEWERYLPLLQNFVDTLHLEDPSGSATALNKGLP